jgi:predicted nuclease of predicted toxin-antitoxin system
MQFKLDENLPRELTDRLRAAGHPAVNVLDQRMGGQADELIADVCTREQRALVTLDMDFADIRAYPPEDYCGLIV